MAVRTISTKLAISGESEYRASVQRINSEIKTLQSALKLTESEFKNNANSMAALTSKGDALSNLYKAQKAKVEELSSALKNAQKAEQQYAEQKDKISSKIEENNKRLEELKNTAGDTSEEEKRLSDENKELAAQLEKCNANLDASHKGVNAWQTQLNSAEAKLIDLNNDIQLNSEYLEEAKKSTDGCATSIDRFGDRVKESAEKSNTLRDALMAAGVVAALKKTAEALIACSDAAAEYESGIAGVAKTTDLSKSELSDMADEIQKLSERIPATTTEIAGVVEAAGQLGIAKEDLLSFSEVMVNLGVATNLTSEEAASSLAKFANVVGMSASNYEKLGSVIVDLGNNFATTEADIVSMATRLSSTGAIVGLTEPQIMAIATALSSVGIEAEAGGSAISKLLKQFETMVATGSPKLTDFAAVAGLSAEEFAQKWGEDAVSALGLFIDGLGEIDRAGGSSVAVLDDLGIKEVRLSNAVQALASSHGILNKAIETADEAWAQNTALAKEAATRYETTESKMQMLANAANNVKISIGDKLNPALADFAESGTDMLSWLSDAIEESDMLVPALTAGAVAIGAMTVGVLGYTAATKAATVATEIFNAITKDNPYLLVATAIASVAAGLVTLAVTMDDNTPKVADFTEAASGLKESFEGSEKTFEDAQANIIATADVAGQYVDKLRALEEQGLNTAAAQDEYRITVDALRSIMPDLNIQLDEQTGLLVGGADALEMQINGWRELAIQEAITTKYKDEIKAWAEAEVEVYENQVKLNTAEQEAAVIEGKIEALKAKMIANYQKQLDVMNDTTMSAADQKNTYSELTLQYGEMDAELRDLMNQLIDNSDLQDTLNDAIDEGTEAVKEYEGMVTDAKAVLESYSETANDAADGMGNLTDNLDKQQYSVVDITQALQELAKDYGETYESSLNSINGQIGLFNKFAADASEDVMTVEEMMSTWAEQTANLAKYTENLQLAARYGIDEGLLVSLSDGSTQSAAHIAEIIAKIEELGGTTEGMSADAASFVENFNNSFSDTIVARDNLAKTTSALKLELAENLEEIEAAADAVNFDGFNQAVENAFAGFGIRFEQVGAESGAAFQTGIASGAESSVGVATEVGNQMVAAANKTAEMTEVGKADVDGMAQGAKDAEPALEATMTEIADNTDQTMTEAAQDSVDSFDKEFQKISDRTRTTLTTLQSTITSATSSMPGKMQTLGSDCIDGMIRGINNRSGALYSTMYNTVSTALEKAKQAADSHSPSRKTIKLFEDIDEGMIIGAENKRPQVVEKMHDVVNQALNVDVTIPRIDDNLPVIPKVYEGSGNDALCKEVKNVRDTLSDISDRLDRMEGRGVQGKVVLDTGALVGKLVDPMDRALGSKRDYSQHWE